jgi:RNA exonuclease 4
MEDAIVREAVKAAMARERQLAQSVLVESVLPDKPEHSRPEAKLASSISKKVPKKVPKKVCKKGAQLQVDGPPVRVKSRPAPDTAPSFKAELVADSGRDKAVSNSAGTPLVRAESFADSARQQPTDSQITRAERDNATAAPANKRSAMISRNWQSLRKVLQAEKPPQVNLLRRPRLLPRERPSEAPASSASKISVDGAASVPPKCSMFLRGALRGGPAKLTKVVALDCEFVGVGEGGREDALARASLVNSRGEVLYDSFVRVDRPIFDYRTAVSGVRAEDLTNPDAADPKSARAEIAEILRGRILVGHAVGNDLRVLRITHPRKDIRDTADYFKRLWQKHGRRGAAPPALRQVVAKILGVDQFQTLEHDSCEDARAALALYKKSSKEWESSRRRK